MSSLFILKSSRFMLLLHNIGHVFQLAARTKVCFIGGLLLSLTTLIPASAADNPHSEKSSNTQPTCIHIASYAPGYVWQDGVDRGIQQQLKNKCRIKTFYMNSKKVKSPEKLHEIGLLAKNFIEESLPDVVIISDDNAAEYVLEAHFKNHHLPFVFCAINNSAKHYGLPYKNTTGMIEVAPTQSLLQQILSMNSGKNHVAYLTTQGNTAAQNIAEFHNIVQQLHIKSSAYQAHTQEDWRTLYRQLQQDPDVTIIILGNYVAFPRWDAQVNQAWVKQYNQKLTLATQPWMMPYAAFGITKSSDEQGQWAALTALEILNGTPIDQLETVANQQAEILINKRLAQAVENLIPKQLMRQAIVYQEADLP